MLSWTANLLFHSKVVFTLLLSPHLLEYLCEIGMDKTGWGSQSSKCGCQYILTSGSAPFHRLKRTCAVCTIHRQIAFTLWHITGGKLKPVYDISCIKHNNIIVMFQVLHC